MQTCRVWSWLGGTCVHGSRAPRSAAGPVHPSEEQSMGRRSTSHGLGACSDLSCHQLLWLVPSALFGRSHPPVVILAHRPLSACAALPHHQLCSVAVRAFVSAQRPLLCPWQSPLTQVQPWAFCPGDLLGQRCTRDLQFMRPHDVFGAELKFCSACGLQTRAGSFVCGHFSPI